MKQPGILLILMMVHHLSVAAIPRTTVQFKGGLIVAHMLITDQSGYRGENESVHEKSIIGGTGGIGVQVKIVDFLLIRPEALFTMKGTVFTTSVGPFNEGLQLSYTCLDIPLYLVLSVPSVDFLLPQLYAGPVWSITAQARYEHDENLTVYTERYTNPFDFSLSFGGGVSTIIKNILISGEVRYSIGFRDVFSYTKDYHLEQQGMHRVFSIVFSLAPGKGYRN